jgi:hypothetical protein
VHIQLAQKYGAACSQAADNLGIVSGNTILEQTAGRRGGRSAYINQIFQGNRYSMERTAPIASLNLILCFLSLCEGRVSRDAYEGVQFWVEPFYFAQTLLRQFDWRHSLAAYQLRGLAETQFGQICAPWLILETRISKIRASVTPGT